MPFASSLITDYSGLESLDQAVNEIRKSLGEQIDLLFVFATPRFGSSMTEWPERLVKSSGTTNVFGCNADSIVFDELEIEDRPAIAIWGARLPGTEVQTCHLQYQSSEDDFAFIGWPDELVNQWQGGVAISIGDPFTFPMDVFLERLNDDQPGFPVSGGMISTATSPGESILIHGENLYHQGAILVVLQGNLRAHELVSQGCRPIGEPIVITKAERNEIHQLGGQPALPVVNDMFIRLPTREQRLVNRGLHVGRVINEYQDRFEPGDFLIRNVVGADPDTGTIVIADYVRAGQTIQFHIRDHETASAELRGMLRSLKERQSDVQHQGGLLFNCNGRGRMLFDVPNHDAAMIQKELGPMPLAGFFAAGEIGVVGGKNFLHGFTASLVLFEE